MELIINKLKGYNMETVDGLLIKENPGEAGLETYRQFGRKIAQKVKGH